MLHSKNQFLRSNSDTPVLEHDLSLLEEGVFRIHTLGDPCEYRLNVQLNSGTRAQLGSSRSFQIREDLVRGPLARSSHQGNKCFLDTPISPVWRHLGLVSVPTYQRYAPFLSTASI